MAHNLATIDGRIAMAYQGETPWHKLGTRIDSDPSIAGALQAAALDWTVTPRSTFLDDGRQVPNCRAIVRDFDGQILSTVSDSYSVIQYADAFRTFQPAATEYGLTVEAAGALGKGERAWMLFKLPTSVEPVPGDEVNGYGLAVTGHTGSQAFEFRPTPIRVVCQNTLNAAIGANGFGRGSVKNRVFAIHHIGNTDAAVKEAGQIVKNVLAAMKETGETFASMARKALTPEQVIEFIEQTFPADDDGKVSAKLEQRRRDVTDLVFSGTGVDLATQETDGMPNAWSVYNAVTEYFDHVAAARWNTAGFQRQANQSAIFGSANDLKLASLNRLRALVAA